MNKQVLFLVNIIFFSLISCSSNENEQSESPKLLLNYMGTYVFENNEPRAFNINFIYDENNRLIQTKEENEFFDISFTNFIYEEGRLIRLENKDRETFRSFEYKGNNIKKTFTHDVNNGAIIETENYTYDLQSRLIKSEKTGTNLAGEEYSSTFKYEYLPNNIVRTTDVSLNNNTVFTAKFDTKNSYFSAIPFLEAYFKTKRYITTSFSIPYYSENNIVYFKNSYMNDQIVFEGTFENTYDKDGFIIKKIENSTVPRVLHMVDFKQTTEYTYNR